MPTHSPPLSMPTHSPPLSRLGLQAADELLTTTGVRSRVQFAPWELAPSLPRAGVSKRDSYLAKIRRSSRDPEVHH